MKLDHIKIEVVQRCPHWVELVLGLDDESLKPLCVSPLFLLFGQRPISALTAPFGASAADPAIKNPSIRKFDDVTKFSNQLRKFDVCFLRSYFMTDFVRDGNQCPVVICSH